MIAGLVLEGVSLFCYALLTRALLPPEGRPRISRLFRIDLAAAAVAHVIPAGTDRQRRRWRVPAVHLGGGWTAPTSA